jgi:hypothetical protein
VRLCAESAKQSQSQSQRQRQGTTTELDWIRLDCTGASLHYTALHFTRLEK